MKIDDPLYGNVEITDEILLALLDHKSVLRLKGIKQSGLIAYINNYSEFTRYDHSVGCMLLLRHLGAPLEEQVAALLHDISHTAFSYVLDSVFSDNFEKNYHDYFKERIIYDSNLPDLLIQYGIDPQYVLNKHNFILLERKTPTMCADRIDYALRTLLCYFNKKNTVTRYYNSLLNFNGEMVFRDREVAAEFAYDFLHLDTTVYTNYRNQTAFYLLSDAIRIALDRDLLHEDDFLLTDTELWNTLWKISDETVHTLMAFISPSLRTHTDPDDYDYVIYTKPRYVNPGYIESDGYHTLYIEDPEFREVINRHKATIMDEYRVKITT
jgi:uncharacterized protein